MHIKRQYVSQSPLPVKFTRYVSYMAGFAAAEQLVACKAKLKTQNIFVDTFALHWKYFHI